MTATGQKVGYSDLLDAVERIEPQLHIFGHIHEAFGIFSNQHTTFINASTCDRSYELANNPIVHVLP